MSDLAALESAYLAAALRGHRRAALALLQGALDDGVPAETLLSEVVRASQQQVGELWELNRIGTAQEHLATAVAQAAAAVLFAQLQPAPPNGLRLALACVQGERHGFPARLAADAFELAGFEVAFLGADLPLRDLVGAVEADAPDVVGLSATLLHTLPTLRESLTALRAFLPHVVRVVGGRAALPVLLDDDPDVLLCPGPADALVAQVQRRVSARTPGAGRG